MLNFIIAAEWAEALIWIAGSEKHICHCHFSCNIGIPNIRLFMWRFSCNIRHHKSMSDSKLQNYQITNWEYGWTLIWARCDIEDEDVLVFLHIQKTGGTTSGSHLVRDLKLESPCIRTKNDVIV